MTIDWLWGPNLHVLEKSTGERKLRHSISPDPTASPGPATAYLRTLSALGGFGLQVLADVPAGAEAAVCCLLVDLPDVVVRLGGHIPEGAGEGCKTQA